MNIKLVHNKSSFNVDILNDTPCQYLFEVAHKIFRIPIDEIELKYEDIEIQNNSRLLFSVMGKNEPDNITGHEIIIVSKIKKRLQSIYNSNTNKEESLKLPLINSITINNDQSKQIEKTKSKKKGVAVALTCQICNHKNSIFYCRVCNLFICFECNVRFNEHKNHERINLEDGDSFLGCDVYREELINEINVIELGYQKALEWIIDTEDRENFLQELFNSLEQIRHNSSTLADMKTLYNLDQEIINDFKEEIDKIPKPRHREEVFEIYGNLNLKENELRNYIKFLNLEIIKTEYNKVLLKCLNKVKKNLDKLSIEVKAKLAECEDIKFHGLEEVQLYIKESKLEKNQMNICNYLSKNYKSNDIQNNNIKNNIFLNVIKNKDSNISLITKNNINIYNNNAENKVFNRNNNSLYEKEINKTIDKKDKPIKLIGENIENKNKKIKKIYLDNNFKSFSKDKIYTKKLDLSPLKTSKNKNYFQIKDSDIDQIINEKPKIKIINLTSNSNKQELTEKDFNDDKKFINLIKKTREPKKEVNLHEKNKKYEINNANNIIKQTLDSDKTLKHKLSNLNSIYQTFTTSEKKIIFNPPIGVKNNSYGKTILNKKKIFTIKYDFHIINIYLFKIYK